MTTAVEKAKSAVARRTRLEIVDDAIAQRETKLVEAHREIQNLVGREEEAAAESLRADPLKSAFALRSPAQELGRKRADLEKTLGHVERELVLLQAERVEAAREHAERELASYIDEARDLLARERNQRLAAGKLLTQLAEKWDALRPILEQRSELHRQVAAEKLLDVLADTDAERRWSEVGHFAVEPVPATFGSFVEELLADALGDRRDFAAERAETDSQNERRRAFDQPPLPYPPPLSPREEEVAALVPDLREARKAALGDDVPLRRAHADEAPWPDRAA